MVDQRLREALIDVQTIIIVGLLYGLLREEQSNAYFRIWLSDNFPLGLYILAPLTVAAISATLLLITTVRVLIFVTNRDLVPETEKTINRLGKTARRSHLLISVRRTRLPVIILSGVGLALSLYSYFVISVVPITALGISCVILGLTMESLPSDTGGSRTNAMLHEATLTLEAQLGQWAVQRAIYIQPVDGGPISAYVPLGSKANTVKLAEMLEAPRSITDGNQEGVLVNPAGAGLTQTLGFDNEVSVEDRLRYILVEKANLCSQVMAEQTGSRIIVGMKEPDLSLQGPKYLESLGSLPSSLAACVIVSSDHRPLTLVEERRDDERMVAIFQELDG